MECRLLLFQSKKTVRGRAWLHAWELEYEKSDMMWGMWCVAAWEYRD
jgi:hypothetical protein